MKFSKTRLILITAIFTILSAVYICYAMNAGGMFRQIMKGVPLAFLTICGCIWGRKHPLVVVALFFSTLGDYAGEFKVPGIETLHMMIIFFGIAQIHYVLEFLKYRRPKRIKTSDKVYALSPVVIGIYALLLIGNVVHSCLQSRDRKWMFVIGSWLFLISDSMILARVLWPGHAFYGPAIMITYFIAQYLLSINTLAADEQL